MRLDVPEFQPSDECLGNSWEVPTLNVGMPKVLEGGGVDILIQQGTKPGRRLALFVPQTFCNLDHK